MAASVAQLAEQLICNQQVAGSTPAASSLGNGHAAEDWLDAPPGLWDGVSAAGPFWWMACGRQAVAEPPRRDFEPTDRRFRTRARPNRLAKAGCTWRIRRSQRERLSQKDVNTGEFPERSKGSDCKSDGIAFAGSNPALPTHPRPTPSNPTAVRRARRPFGSHDWSQADGESGQASRREKLREKKKQTRKPTEIPRAGVAQW